MAVKHYIPNTITCGNLFCGCLAIIKCFEGDLLWAGYLVGIAAVFDFLDGFAARMLRVTSAIGKDLDSLADMVTFGVVPGMVMFQLIKKAVLLQNFEGCVSCPNPGHFENASSLQSCMPYMALIIPVLSAVRLAIFNNDTRQTVSFIGLPTPANGIFICSLPLVIHFSRVVDGSVYANTGEILILNSSLLISLTLIMSFLLLAQIPLFSLKFKTFSWLGNRTRYLFLISCILLFVFFQFVGIPLTIILYILFSVIDNFIKKQKT